MEYTFIGDEESTTLPHIMEVCPRCNGEGTQDVWEGGMTGDEMAEQGPEFLEDYLSGMYSKPCEECKGKNVVQVVNRKAITPELLARYEADELQIMQWQHEIAMDY